MTYRDYKHLECDFPEEGILRITFNNPGKLNSVTAGMHTELTRIWADIDRSPEVKVVLVTGADGTFSAGGDMSIIEANIADFENRIRTMREARDIVYGVINCSRPVVSAMGNVAVGAGLAVGLLADVSIVTPTCRIFDGHTKLGVAAGDCSVIVWPLLCGMAKAKYYLLTCDKFLGADAERAGLVSLCVPDEELADKALEVCRKLANGSQSAIRWTKQTLNHWLRDMAPAFDASAAYELIGFGGPDVIEGLAAIKEKRQPVFTGPADI